MEHVANVKENVSLVTPVRLPTHVPFPSSAAPSMNVTPPETPFRTSYVTSRALHCMVLSSIPLTGNKQTHFEINGSLETHF